MSQKEKLSVGELTVRIQRGEDNDQAAHITDISNSATGTQIATAVNAILTALENVGILASS